MRLGDEWSDLIDAVRVPPPESIEPADSWDRILTRRAYEAPAAQPTQTITITAKRLPKPTTSVILPSGEDTWARIEARRAALPISHAKTPPWPFIMAAAFGGLLLLNAINEKAPS